jgi:nucleoside-diphosphate-sugar epimerase
MKNLLTSHEDFSFGFVECEVHFCDVRDAAEAMYKAAVNRSAAGHRHVVISPPSGHQKTTGSAAAESRENKHGTDNGRDDRTTSRPDVTTLKGIADLIAAEFGQVGYKVQTRVLPNWAAKVYSVFDKNFRLFVHSTGNDKRICWDTTRVR